MTEISYKTVIEQANAIIDAFIGPSPYHGVTLLQHAAEHCSNQCLIASTVNEQDCNDWAAACLFCENKADELDRELVEQFSWERAR